jgi:hypothetical protein
MLPSGPALSGPREAPFPAPFPIAKWRTAPTLRLLHSRKSVHAPPAGARLVLDHGAVLLDGEPEDVSRYYRGGIIAFDERAAGPGPR